MLLKKFLFRHQDTTITQQTTDPPARGGNLQETLQGEEDSEGRTEGLHHVDLVVGVTTELRESKRWIN